MGVLRYKILRDIWHHKGRTLQVVLIIGIGAAAIGMILGTRNLMVPGMQDIWTSMNPATINVFAFPPVTEDELALLSREPDVADAEGLSNTVIEWRRTPQEDWQPGGLKARADYEHQRLNMLELVQGSWPTETTIAGGQDAETYFGIPVGSTVYLRVNEREFSFTVDGLVYDQLVQPAYLGGTAQFYTTPDRYEYMVGNRDFDQVMVSMDSYEESRATELADRLQARLEKMGKSTGRMITDPNKHFFQDQMDGLFFLLTVLGALALVLGLLLVYNTVNALIAQQVDQIGVMKAIGGRTGQILRLYLFNVLIYGLLALAVALPIGILGGWGISSWLVDSFGADPGAFEVDQTSLLVIVVICLLAPLLASLIPIYSGARITVREAISTYGLRTNTGLIERLLARARHVSRLVLITISNTFRHKGRVVLMQITLVISGLIFMMVISVRDSVSYTINDVIFAILDANVTMVLEEPQRIDHLEELTLAYPNVERVEMWALSNPSIRPQGQAESEDDESLTLFGVPLPTELYGYQLRAGRWLDPGDTYALVLNEKLAGEIEVGVGDWVTLQYDDTHQRDWLVVGLVFDPILVQSANVPREVLLRDLHMVGRASTVWIRTTQTDMASEQATAKGLREYYAQLDIPVSAQRGVFGIGGDSTKETAAAFIGQFNFVVILLAIMAVIMGVVGSIALSGALSLSVMERRREIGVMRAIGASSWAIGRLFIGEGLILGWLSWLIALPLSLPAGQVMVQALGAAFNLSLVYRYTFFGAGLWFGIITLLSILASWLPARGATHISVRESLAYQ